MESLPVALIFVTDMVTGKPVKGVDVSVYAKEDRKRVRQLGKKTVTNQDGIARIELASTSREDSNQNSTANSNNRPYTFVVFVEDGARLMHIEDVMFTPAASKTHVHDALILDRKLLQPNETLYVKGTSLFSSSMHP